MSVSWVVLQYLVGVHILLLVRNLVESRMYLLQEPRVLFAFRELHVRRHVVVISNVHHHLLVLRVAWLADVLDVKDPRDKEAQAVNDCVNGMSTLCSICGAVSDVYVARSRGFHVIHERADDLADLKLRVS